MTSSEMWQKMTIDICNSLGTYRDEFLPMIETLSDILAERDRVYDQYVKEGSETLVIKESYTGVQNLIKNPLLATWEDLNKDALTYWRDLGMTPAGLKKLNASVVSVKAASAGIEQILAGLESDG